MWKRVNGKRYMLKVSTILTFFFWECNLCLFWEKPRWSCFFPTHWKHSSKWNRQEDCQHVHDGVLNISLWLHQLCRAVMHGWPHWSLIGWHCVMLITYVHIFLFGLKILACKSRLAFRDKKSIFKKIDIKFTSLAIPAICIYAPLSVPVHSCIWKLYRF